jgi:hypothetical protein
MVVFFILLTLVVQIAFLVIARNAAATAVDATVRRIAITPMSLDDERGRLARDVQATVPGTADLEILLEQDGTVIYGSISFKWRPPGPDLLPVTISVERSAPVVVPP